MTEKILDHTREEWQRDMMRLEKIANYLYTVQRKAGETGKPDIQAEAMKDCETILRAKVFLEWLLESYQWKEEARPTQ